jgi:hypothetical protein
MARHLTSRGQATSPSDPVRITTAGASRNDDISARQRRYLLAMGFRTLCFVGAVFVQVTWLRVILVIGALVLPYVAVVMANAGSTKSDGFALLDGASGSRQLPEGAGSDLADGQDHL